MTTQPDYRQHLEVETPELVVIDYEIAGIGSRALAALIDTLIILGLTLAAMILAARFGLLQSRLFAALWVVLWFALVWGYYAFFEGLRHGQTPGKRRVGIRVIRDTGHPVTLGAAALRNIVRIADFMPPPYLIGALAVALHPSGKRLGDIVAGTIVVRDRPHPEVAPPRSVPTARGEEPVGVPELTDDEFRLVREFSERAPALPAPVRERVAAGLAPRFAERYPTRPADPIAFLESLFRDELARRQGRFAARSAAPREAGQGPAGGVAERLVARQGARWAEFEKLAARSAREGLDSFAAAELPDFAARYREVAADLARARTYQAPPPVRARLERLVAAGHNALYLDKRRSGEWFWRFLTRECPASIIVAWRTVLIAFLVFAVPAGGGYLLLQERPQLAEEVLSATMLERAEAGAARQAEGKGYYEAELGDRPLMASQIMTNNIQVAFFCFASGVFAGIGSLFLLGFNGLMIGATTGHFANQGLAGYLWSFVIGHGVLELFAIWVAGAAGFLLGKALLAPGEYSRSDALRLTGRVAVRLVGATVVLLVLAGLIEGFVSASDVPLGYRLAVSSTSLVFLLLYLANGWGEARNLAASLRGEAPDDV